MFHHPHLAGAFSQIGRRRCGKRASTQVKYAKQKQRPLCRRKIVCVRCVMDSHVARLLIRFWHMNKARKVPAAQKRDDGSPSACPGGRNRRFDLIGVIMLWASCRIIRGPYHVALSASQKFSESMSLAGERHGALESAGSTKIARGDNFVKF